MPTSSRKNTMCLSKTTSQRKLKFCHLGRVQISIGRLSNIRINPQRESISSAVNMLVDTECEFRHWSSLRKAFCVKQTFLVWQKPIWVRNLFFEIGWYREQSRPLHMGEDCFFIAKIIQFADGICPLLTKYIWR